jgi:hypothetical protein
MGEQTTSAVFATDWGIEAAPYATAALWKIYIYDGYPNRLLLSPTIDGSNLKRSAGRLKS